jgi:hypothetical protein
MGQVPSQSFAVAGKRAWPTLIGGLGALITGLWMLHDGEHTQIAWANVALGVVLTFWFGQVAWRRAPMLWFDDGGLRARMHGFPPVPWEDIERVRFVRVDGRALLVLERKETARRRRPGGRWPRALARRAKAGDLAVPIDGLTAAPAQVYAVVELAHRFSQRGSG